ncbi:hypothetical protein EV359DRAFT_69295, partial [Lentinula novae-zelandiae]
MREVLERVERVKAWKVEEAARRKAEEEEAARRAAEQAQMMEEATAQAGAARRRAVQKVRDRTAQARQQEEEMVERRRRLADAATARSHRETSPSEPPVSPRRPVVEVPRVVRSKGKGKAKAQPVGEDPDDGDDSDNNDDNKEERTPCERCRSKKISCQMQAGKRSSIICKPCHDAKVRCSYSNWPFTVKQEGGRRNSPPEMPEAGPSRLPKERRRVVDSEEEDEGEREREEEEDEEGKEEG